MKCKRVEIKFEKMWTVKERFYLCSSIVGKLLDKLRGIYDIRVLKNEDCECAFSVSDEEVTKQELTEKIYSVLDGISRNKPDEGIVRFSVEEWDCLSDEQENERQLEKTKKHIAELVGAEEFKALMQELETVAEGLKRNNLCDLLSARTYLFSINDGEGLSTYAELMAKMLDLLKIKRIDKCNPVRECRLEPAGRGGGDMGAFSEAMSAIDKISEHGAVIVIDMSEWMTEAGSKSFRSFLEHINDEGKKHVYIFRVPFVEREVLCKIKNAISDVLSVKDISFVPFDGNELAETAKLKLREYGYTAEENVWEIFGKFINAEKRDGRFYGIRTVEKLVREMLYCKQLHNSLCRIDDKTLKREELEGMGCVTDDERDAFECFDELIGMEETKKRVEEIILQIKTALKSKAVESPCIHMRFVGNPGTGKTTVARLLGKALRQNGVLRNGNFFEYHGRSLCGRFVGETAPKTSAICRDAYGSVLFIDEAYSLFRGENATRGDYGQEAIDTLIAEMENHRSDFVVIMAGYTDEMDNLMKANSGLESRMPYVIEFPNYTREQLFSIFMDMVKKSYGYNEAFEQEVKAFFDSISDGVLSSKEFSNARFVRNLFERTWGKAVMRASVNKQECTALTKEDFLMAIGEKEFRSMLEKKEKRTIGFA